VSFLMLMGFVVCGAGAAAVGAGVGAGRREDDELLPLVR